MPQRIGIGIITCNRESLFRKCIAKIPSTDRIIVINDGHPYPQDAYPSGGMEIHQHKNNLGVGRSKNEALRYLMMEGCTHIFLSEDDVRVQDERVFSEYIRASEVSGIMHLNYGLHGPANKNALGAADPRTIVEYRDNVRVAFYRYPVGAFSYYHKEVLDRIGLMDERYKNFHEHVDHTLRICRAGYHTPYAWFADLADSDRYISDLDPSLSLSMNRKPHWLFLLKNYGYFTYYTMKNGIRREGTESEFRESIKRISDGALSR